MNRLNSRYQFNAQDCKAFEQLSDEDVDRVIEFLTYLTAFTYKGIFFLAPANLNRGRR